MVLATSAPIIKSILKNKKQGFFVDVGCYHPFRFSNTYLLYRRGWRGINIDMEQHKINLFHIARKEDVNITAAASDQVQELYLHSQKRNDLGAHLSSDVNISKETVTTKRLDDIIGTTKYKGRKIDLLSVDVEGHELQVLRSLDFSIYSPSVIIVELHSNSLSQIIESGIHHYLDSKHYNIRSFTPSNLIYSQGALN